MKIFSLLAAAFCLGAASVVADNPKVGHRSGHKAAKAVKLHATKVQQEPDAEAPKPADATPADVVPSAETEKKIAEKLEEVVTPADPVAVTAAIDVNGPLPADFGALFAQSAADAIPGAEPSEIKIIETNVVQSVGGVLVEVVFQAPSNVAAAIQEQAADGDSALATGALESFLVARDDVHSVSTPPETVPAGVSINTEMPFGTLEPFGREDTAQELTEASIHESDAMVDQIERAQVAEEKRSVFRALTRLRGAAITSFDGVARAQTGNIDEYSQSHKWRNNHPLQHLAAEEANTRVWAFPKNAD